MAVRGFVVCAWKSTRACWNAGQSKQGVQEGIKEATQEDMQEAMREDMNEGIS